jgi:hypothetical protein
VIAGGENAINLLINNWCHRCLNAKQGWPTRGTALGRMDSLMEKRLAHNPQGNSDRGNPNCTSF